MAQRAERALLASQAHPSKAVAGAALEALLRLLLLVVLRRLEREAAVLVGRKIVPTIIATAALAAHRATLLVEQAAQMQERLTARRERQAQARVPVQVAAAERQVQQEQVLRRVLEMAEPVVLAQVAAAVVAD